jgi:predicted nucleotidyltransferase
MNVSHPIRGVIPSLDGPVLEVLAGTTRSLTGREVARLAAIGSVRGVRLVLARLEMQGLVIAEQRGGAILYQANREHLAWPALERLARLRATLIERLSGEIEGWPISAIHASLFGSAARGDGDASSDIDIVVIPPSRADPEPWTAQIDELRMHVETWTGNRCQVIDIDKDRLYEHVAARDRIVDAWIADGVFLAGVSLEKMLVGLVSPGPRPPRPG